jgi:hypothetical protein
VTRIARAIGKVMGMVVIATIVVVILATAKVLWAWSLAQLF